MNRNDNQNDAIRFVEQIISQPDGTKFNLKELLLLALDNVSDFVFISDSITKNVLYVNKPLATALNYKAGVPTKCYTLLHNKTKQCPHCRINSFEGEGFILTHNNLCILDQSVILKSAHFNAQGHPFTVSIAKPKAEAFDIAPDISAIKNEPELLIKILQTLANHTDSPNLQIFSTIQFIGQLVNADSVSVYEPRKIDINIKHTLQRSSFWSKDERKDIADDQESNLPIAFVEHAAETADAALYKTDSLTDDSISSQLKKCGVSQVQALPIIHDREIIGFLFIRNHNEKDYEKCRSIIQVLIDFISVMLYSKLQSIELTTTKNIDALTGLRNRNALLIDLKGYSSLSDIGIVFVNINGLKDINESHGLKQGDSVIIQTGKLIKELLHTDNVYRISGDEFFALVPEISIQEFEDKCDILSAFLSNDSYFTAAIGCEWIPQGQNILQALHHAERKMFENKRSFYREHPDTERYRNSKDFIFNIISPDHIEELITGKCFQVYYQPKFNLGNGMISGAEALIRLKINGKMIPPNDFIPTLDASHYTYLIDLFVIENVCATMRERMDKGLTVLPVSCNFSRHTIVMSDFIEKITSIMQHYRIPYSMLTLEISEQSNTIYRKELIEATISLAAHGFNISIDDFGVAHANIWALADLPVNEIKFDKKLIDSLLQPNNFKIITILNVMITMCRKMHIGTVAEGVEEESQEKILKKLGCDELQGYLRSRPVEEAVYYDMVQRENI